MDVCQYKNVNLKSNFIVNKSKKYLEVAVRRD